MPDTAPASARSRSAWRPIVIGAGVLVTLALGIVGVLTVPPADPLTTLTYDAPIVAALSLVLTGAVLAVRLPGHPVGWLLWAGGWMLGAGIGSGGFAQAVATSVPALAAWLTLIGQATWVPAVVCVMVLLPLEFPTGRLPSPRWRIVVVVGLVSGAFSVAQSALTPFPVGSVPAGIQNPIAAGTAAADVANALGDLSSVAGVICLPLVAASLILRFRRSTGVERAQLKWLAAAVAVAGPSLAIAITASVVPGNVAAFVSTVAFLATFVGLALLPVAIGIAVLRYRLYDIDLIIRRTVVYVPLTAILAGLYAGSTALFQKAFILATGQRSDGAIIASTLILATVFTPVKGWLQGIVDRRFRDQLDTERQIDAFIARVGNAEWAPDPDRTMRAFLRLVVAALEATGGRALVLEAGDPRIVATIGRADTPAIVIGVESDGQRLGRIELGPRTRERAYRPSEVELVRAAGRRLGDAVRGVEPPAEPPRPSSEPAADADVPGVEFQAEPGQG